MDSLADMVKAADNGWAVLAIIILGMYVLAWRFGGEILRLARENNAAVKRTQVAAEETRTETQAISENIITNHGSKNLGDAIDRITDWMLMHLEESREADRRLSELRKEFISHLVSGNQTLTRVEEKLVDLDTRVEAVEDKKE